VGIGQPYSSQKCEKPDALSKAALATAAADAQSPGRIAVQGTRSLTLVASTSRAAAATTLTAGGNPGRCERQPAV
jgi:hypothetical protein